ncbi:DUF5691 domain-containing protein [Leptolyngbya sp. AN03gr2]|uniref:DUF5691 domain-containing protein n=1 Tax=unclassified Leptolyngbya TaxID=2650499 RepID=UPI003D31B435
MDSNLWKEITSAALLGTERQPFKSIVTSGKLGQILQMDETRSSESALLLSAGILSLYQQAGQQPQKDSTVPFPACDLNDQPCCRPRAASFLQQILESGSTHSEHLSEWLELAAQKEQRVPEQCLSRLLTLAASGNRLQKILPILGERGRWLAAQNSEWNTAIDPFTEIDWETSTEKARRVYLRQLRQVQPDQARELLQSTWKEESAEVRTQFLEVLHIELSMADEPFLEEQLNDRSKAVRRKAADLLVRLPDSRYCDRMIQRLTPLIKPKSNVIKPKSNAIEITVPASCDSSMQRDGLEPKPPSNKQYGNKAWWLLQLVAATPLTVWQTQSGLMNLATIVEQGKRSEWYTALREGWQQAAKAQNSAEWAQVLLQDSKFAMDTTNLRSLLEILQPEQRDHWLCQLFEKTPSGIRDPYIFVVVEELGKIDSYWSEQLAQHFLESLSTHVTEFEFYWELERRLKGWTRRFPRSIIPSAIVQLENMIKDDLPAYTQAALNFAIAILKFRQDMIQSFEN